MATILRYVREIIPIAIKEIVDGNVERSPIEGSCNGCSYKTICGGVEEGEERASNTDNSPLNVIFDEGENYGD